MGLGTSLKIGEVARRGGVNLQTIRYYEREGLLPEPPRLASGYRMFPAEAVHRLLFIKRAQELGFSLAEIRELLSIRIDAGKDCVDVRRLAREKLLDISAKIQSLQRMQQVLLSLTQMCPGTGPPSQCPILASMEPPEVHA